MYSKLKNKIQMKKLITIITLFLISMSSYSSNIYSGYRSMKRDANTAHEINENTGGALIPIVISIVIISIIWIILQYIFKQIKRKQKLAEIELLKQEGDKLLTDNNYELAINKYKLAFVEYRDLYRLQNDGRHIRPLTNNVKKEVLDRFNVLKHNINYTEHQFDLILKEKRKRKLVDKYGEEKASKIINKEFYIGMTNEELLESIGGPTKKEEEVLKTKTKETWIYGNKSSGDVFVFENGVLVRFKDR